MVFLLSFHFLCPSSNVAEWTFLSYVEADNDLAKFMVKNLKDMAKVGSSRNVNILVQINKPKKKGMSRYIVRKDKLELVEDLPKEMTGDVVKDLVSSANWAFGPNTKYPSKYKALIEGDHGSGILDPTKWSTSLGRFNGLSTGQRGMFFNYSTLTYMNNQQHIEALKKIKDQVLGGKKLNILGMDACLMAMVEVGFQVKDYAELFVSSQEVASALGWPYDSFLKLAENGKMNPDDLVKNIVLSYGVYYKDKVSWYTQSAVDLTKMDLIKEHIDQIIIDIVRCQQVFGFTSVKNIVHSARKASLQFNLPCYIDLHSFFTELYKRLDMSKLRSQYQNAPWVTQSSIFSNENIMLGGVKDIQSKSVAPINDISVLAQLKEKLLITTKLIENIVLANAYGQGTSRARGLSIYYPEYGIDSSYPKTEFAKSSLWMKFLIDML